MATVSSIAPLAPAAPPTARPILGVDRRTGAFVALVPSCSQPNVYHITTPTSCSCKGFSYRKRCSHLAPAQPEPLPCSSCHNYHRTDAERLKAHPDARRELAPGGAAWLAVQKAAGGWPR
jgi:hypothetical protein